MFRYDTTNSWFKGNTHIHSTRSDGGMEIADIAALYASGGYDFLFATDHMVPSDFASDGSGEGAPLVWIDGVELHGKTETGAFYHVVCLGKVSGVTPETPFADALRIAGECGALRILAHPLWTGNSLDEALAVPFDGVEIYNHVCRWLNGKDDGRAHWFAMLDSNPATLAFASDDAHLKPEHPGWNGGWVMVNAPQCTPAVILDAICRGNYYSTCGPEFRAIACEGRKVRIETSPVRYARLVGPGAAGARMGGPDNDFTEAEFDVPETWAWAVLEIEDAQGKRAWTNGLFV